MDTLRGGINMGETSFQKMARDVRESVSGGPGHGKVIMRGNTMISGAFDPEGSDYDMETALKSGLKPDKTGHWPSRDPNTGIILKGKGHPTFDLTEKGEEKAGYKIIKGKDGRYYSIPKTFDESFEEAVKK